MPAPFVSDRIRDLVGKTFVDRSHDVVLKFNGTAYDRFDLARIGVFQVGSAMKLNLILQRLGITEPLDLARRVHDLPSIRGAGKAVFYVAMALLDQNSRFQEGVTTWKAESKHMRMPTQSVMFDTIKRRKKVKQRTVKGVS